MNRTDIHQLTRSKKITCKHSKLRAMTGLPKDAENNKDLAKRAPSRQLAELSHAKNLGALLIGYASEQCRRRICATSALTLRWLPIAS